VRPYYYVICLHAAGPGHNGWVSFMALADVRHDPAYRTQPDRYSR
jgi:hypothetical protein